MINAIKPFKKSASLTDDICRYLYDGIVDGRFPMGERLVETDLQKIFQVSRGPIRESLRILEAQGLVIKINNKGTFVKDVTKKDLENHFYIRASLEGLAARQASSQMSQRDISEMQNALFGMENAAQSYDFKRYLKSHSNFHEVFIKASDNNALSDLLSNLRRQSLRFRYAFFYHGDGDQYPFKISSKLANIINETYSDSLNTHREILNHFISRDADKAALVVSNHIEQWLHLFVNEIFEK